jgi:hypothetical protein
LMADARTQGAHYSRPGQSNPTTAGNGRGRGSSGLRMHPDPGRRSPRSGDRQRALTPCFGRRSFG